MKRKRTSNKKNANERRNSKGPAKSSSSKTSLEIDELGVNGFNIANVF